MPGEHVDWRQEGCTFGIREGGGRQQPLWLFHHLSVHTAKGTRGTKAEVSASVNLGVLGCPGSHRQHSCSCPHCIQFQAAFPVPSPWCFPSPPAQCCSTAFGVAPVLPTTRTGSARGVLGLMKHAFAQRGFPSMPCLWPSRMQAEPGASAESF